MRWRRRVHSSPEILEAGLRFGEVAGVVDQARVHLLLGVPAQRGPRLPLAEALAGFEQGLAEALRAMEGWRIEAVAEEWSACEAGLRRALAGAERLRLEERATEYPDLIPGIEALLQPLEAFDLAATRFRDLGD